MKILYDPIYTGRPSTCSTSYVAWQVIKHFCAQQSDVFFYLTVPKQWWEDPEQQEFWAAQEFTERVTLIPTDTQTTDRLTELMSFPRELVELVSPTSKQCWDADAIITTRIPQLMNYRGNSSRYVSFRHGTYRAVIGLDDMPMLGFRDTVAWGNTGEYDLHTLSQYLGADELVLSDLWTKQEALKLARNYLTPSNVISLGQQISEALPVRLKELQLGPKWKQGEPFNVVFAGRMTGTRNFKEVADVLRKQYSYPLGKGPMRFIISTQSQSIGSINAGELDFFEVQHNNREQFHKLMREEAHVVVNLSTVEDFSLSTYEPMTFGVPVIVPNRPWSGFLGKDYPFRADDFVQAYGLITEFVQNYDDQYDKFVEWHNTTWCDLVNSPRNRSTPEVVHEKVIRHRSRAFDYIETKGIGGTYRETANKIVAEEKGEFDITSYMEKNDLIEWNKDWRKVPVSKRPSLHLMKILLELRGAKDTNKCGVMHLPG